MDRNIRSSVIRAWTQHAATLFQWCCTESLRGRIHPWFKAADLAGANVLHDVGCVFPNASDQP